MAKSATALTDVNIVYHHTKHYQKKTLNAKYMNLWQEKWTLSYKEHNVSNIINNVNTRVHFSDFYINLQERPRDVQCLI